MDHHREARRRFAVRLGSRLDRPIEGWRTPMDTYRQSLSAFDPDISAAIAGEERRQLDGVEMIPSENYTYPEVLAALGSILTNKYSEGYPGRRYYGGQEYTDIIDNIARDRACALFRSEH